MAKVFAVRGSNDEVTVCSCCGRTGLKKTVILEVLDTEGNGTGVTERYGVDCAARASGWTQKEVKVQVKAADEAERNARLIKSMEQARINDALWRGFLFEQTGQTEVAVAVQALGGFAAARAMFKAQA